jgi:crotonobetainyl-CoA:carnitine CoA-transferase CaiB-like acyl-CoA transferase
VGQDTDAVLREIGLTTAQIEALQARGIVGGSVQGQGAA